MPKETFGVTSTRFAAAGRPWPRFRSSGLRGRTIMAWRSPRARMPCWRSPAPWSSTVVVMTTRKTDDHAERVENPSNGSFPREFVESLGELLRQRSRLAVADDAAVELDDGDDFGGAA